MAGIGSLLSGSPHPRAIPNAPTIDDPALAAARNANTSANAGVYGRMATMATGGRGVTAPAVTDKKTLLGG